MTNKQAGFTIIEVLIAITMLSIGLLGALGATASTIRVIGESDRIVTAAYQANRQLEQLEALGCDAATSGSATEQRVNLRWAVAGATTDRTRPITLTASYQMGRGRVRVDTFEKALQCTR
jgi:prepilin-type N-terminal cleavage/methylation domain-containing protein